MIILYTDTNSIPRTETIPMVQATITNPVHLPLQFLVLGVMGFCGSQHTCGWCKNCVEPNLDTSGVGVPRDTTEDALSRG